MGREEEVMPAGADRSSEWPNAVSLVLAGGNLRQRRWAVSAAIQVTRKLAAGHAKVILADLAAEKPALLAEELGVKPGAGIVDVLFRGASFSNVARRPKNETFFFLTLGNEPPPRGVLFQHPRWRKIAERLSDAHAHLLPCLSADDWLESGPIPGFEACIVLNGMGLEVELPDGARRLAEFIAPPHIREDAAAPVAEPAGLSSEVEEPKPPEVERELEATGGREAAAEIELAGDAEGAAGSEIGAPPAPAASRPSATTSEPAGPGLRKDVDGSVPEGARAAEAEEEVEPSGVMAWGRARGGLGGDTAPSFGRRRLDRRTLFVAAAVVAVAAGAFAVWQLKGSGNDVADRPLEAAAPPAGAAERDEPSAREEPGTDAPAEPAGDAPTVEAASGSAGARRAEPLPYSVAIASYSSFQDARERQRAWSRDEVTFYVAPTIVRGVVYYRVFAGLLANRQAADSLMAQLVGAGVKDTLRNWDIRPTRLAFSFGTFPDEAGARSEAERLNEKGIPAYVVAVPGAGAETIAFHVYAGGYENREDARPLRDRIAEAGLDVELVERVGMVSR